MKLWILALFTLYMVAGMDSCQAPADQRMVGPVFGYEEPEDPVFGTYTIHIYKPHRVQIVWPDGGTDE